MSNILVDAAYRAKDTRSERRLARRLQYTRSLDWNQGWLSRYGTRDRLSYVESMVINYIVGYGGLQAFMFFQQPVAGVLWFLVWALLSFWLISQRIRDIGWRVRRTMFALLGLPFIIAFADGFLDTGWLTPAANGARILFILAIGFVPSKE